MRGLGIACVLIWLAGAALAQEAVALFADSIGFDEATGEIVAEGNVEAYYQGRRLVADRIRYDTATETVRAEGAIRLEDPESGTVLLASLAELSADFRNGLIQGARLIFQDRLQIAAVEGAREGGAREGGGRNVLYKTVASSCTVCARNPVPIWRIRARRVVHDEAAERIYFENATFELLGVPVLWVPRLRVPAPGVERAAGFLAPTASRSNVYGLGIKVPYFLPLGDHADVTLTPFVSTGRAAILETEYRQQFGLGGIEVLGVLALTDGRGREGRGFIDGTGEFRLPGGFDAYAALNLASDRSFLGQFNYSDADRLLSEAAISRQTAQSWFEVRAEGYQTLREDEVQGTIPVVFPQVSYRQFRAGDFGHFGMEAGLLALTRQDGRDVYRGSAAVDWRLERITPQGLKIATLGDIAGEAYLVNDAQEFEDRVLARVTPGIGLELRWPLARRTARATHVIEPFATLLYSETLGEETVPNEDSVLPELDENNLLDFNRFPGADRRETGLRLNAGLGYNVIAPGGWEWGATLGRVFRLEASDQFAGGAGLAGRTSDYVAAVSLDTPWGLSVIGRSLFDDRLEFKRAELEVDYLSTGFDFTGSYTFLAGDANVPVLGNVTERQEFSLATRYRVARNWDLSGEWRYDLAAKGPIFAGAGVTFGNECIVASLEVGRRFTQVNSVPRDTEVSVEVTLAGLGGSSEGDWPQRQCQGI